MGARFFPSASNCVPEEWNPRKIGTQSTSTGLILGVLEILESWVKMAARVWFLPQPLTAPETFNLLNRPNESLSAALLTENTTFFLSFGV